MKGSRMVITMMLIIVIFNMCGCNQEKEEELDVKWKVDCESKDERLYETVIGLSKPYIPMQLGVDKTKEGMEKYNGVGDILTRVMLKNIDDIDKEYHVLLWYWGMNDITKRPDGLMTQDIVDRINEQYNRNFQLNEWVQIQDGLNYYYYYVFTADEILDLADYGIKCKYVGSGEGNIEDVDYKTPKGIAIFCELHGDGVIRYKKGQKLYY